MTKPPAQGLVPVVSTPPFDMPSDGQEARRYESQQLLGHADRAYIHHEGRWYCLRRTKQGKLILTA